MDTVLADMCISWTVWFDKSRIARANETAARISQLQQQDQELSLTLATSIAFFQTTTCLNVSLPWRRLAPHASIKCMH